MENQIKNVKFIVLSLVLVFVLIINIEVQTLNEANALQLLPVSFGTMKPQITVPTTSGKFNVHVVVAGFNATVEQNLLTVNASNGVILSNLSLASSIGGNHKFISGVDCQSTSQLFKSTSDSGGGTTWCVVTATGGTGSDRVFLVDITDGLQAGNLAAGNNYANGYMFSNCLIDSIPQTAGTVYCMFSDTNGANHVFIDVWIIPYNYVNGLPTTPKIGNAFVQNTHFDTGYTSGVAQPNYMKEEVIINQITGLMTF